MGSFVFVFCFVFVLGASSPTESSLGFLVLPEAFVLVLSNKGSFSLGGSLKSGLSSLSDFSNASLVSLSRLSFVSLSACFFACSFVLGFFVLPSALLGALLVDGCLVDCTVPSVDRVVDGAPSLLPCLSLFGFSVLLSLAFESTPPVSFPCACFASLSINPFSCSSSSPSFFNLAISACSFATSFGSLNKSLISSCLRSTLVLELTSVLKALGLFFFISATFASYAFFLLI